MSDEDEHQAKFDTQHDVGHQRRLVEIRNELQGLMRQKKKYDEDKLKQEAEFLQSEINDLRTSIYGMSREINNQTQTKKRLHVQMTNLRSRSRFRYTNVSTALRDKRQYEAELKKENKTEEYRELARHEIRSIEAALPILREEDEYKARLKVAEDAQQGATVKRKKLEDSLNKNLRKQTEIKQLLNDNAEKLPLIEADIKRLRSEREQLLSLNTSSSTSGRKSRRRLSSNQHSLIHSPTTNAQIPVRSFAPLEEDRFELEKHQYEDQLNNVNTLINYFRDKLIEHGLPNDQACSTPSSELTSPLYNPLTPLEERSILSSYMNEREPDNVLLTKTSTNEPSIAIAMKLPRYFASLNLNTPTTNEIIHSPYSDGNEVEYKKELSSDILSKYGGQPKKTKLSLSLNGKKHKRNKKNFAIIHKPQMIDLYNSVRSSTDNSDTLPSMPMYEYDLSSTIQSLEFFKQSLECYLNELARHPITTSIDDEQRSKSEQDDDDIRDSALDTYSEASSLVEPIQEQTLPIPSMINNLEGRLSTSSDDRKTLTSSSSSSPPPSNKDNHEKINPHFNSVSKFNGQIDRQISDEGYRSVQNEHQQPVIELTSNHTSPLLTRSKSYNCTDKVDQWLSNSTPTTVASSVPMSLTYRSDFQSTDNEDDGAKTTISVLND